MSNFGCYLSAAVYIFNRLLHLPPMLLLVLCLLTTGVHTGNHWQQHYIFNWLLSSPIVSYHTKKRIKICINKNWAWV